MVDSNESFFSRWSQRKAESRDQPEQESPLSDDSLAGSADEISEESPSIEDAPPELTDEDMPPVESLDEQSDFSQFLSPGVSEELRNLALRKLFMLPEFNLRDGLNDYDDDFSKMPELTEAVVSKLRSWVNDKGDEIKEQIAEDLQGAEEVSTDESQDSDVQKPESLDFSDYEADELGETDIDG